MSNAVPIGWKLFPLKSLADIRSSNVDKKSGESEITVQLCNYTDVYYSNRITRARSFMVATAKQREIDRFILEKGDVIITKDSETPDDIAVPAYVSEDLDNVICGYHLTLLKPIKNRTSGHFLSYLFQLETVQHYFYILANGITRFGLTADAINGAPLLMPPLPEQKKIAAILSTVDDVIEKIQAQIGKLHDLKTGMMQELLTQGIGPDGKPHAEFKDSPVGRIPVEWETCSLVSCGIEVLDGDRGKEYPKETDFVASGYCLFLSAKNVTKDGFKFNALSFISENKDRALRKGKLRRDDIVITTRGTVGNIAYYDHSVQYSQVRINSGMAIFRNVGDSVDTRFLYLLLRSPFIREQIDLLVFGSAQPQLTIGILKELQLVVPPHAEQEAISKALDAVAGKIDLTIARLECYRKLKKGLMQDLLTGKVRVKIDQEVQEAALA